MEHIREQKGSINEQDDETVFLTRSIRRGVTLLFSNSHLILSWELFTKYDIRKIHIANPLIIII